MFIVVNNKICSLSEKIIRHENTSASDSRVIDADILMKLIDWDKN